MELSFKRFRWTAFRKKKQKKKVRFNPYPTVHVIPNITKAERALASEERWQTLLESLAIAV
jgi:hypothetical protein